MILSASFVEERARDALAFDPLPASPWVTAGTDGIEVAVRYGERLSSLLRSLPGARWDAAARVWRFPFSSVAAIRMALPQIDRLAATAQESADRETKRRDAERRRNNEAVQAEANRRARDRAERQPRPFLDQYLHAKEDRPKHPLLIEAIGDNARSAGMPSRSWVARLFGSDGRGGWARVFLAGMKDYAGANCVGSRGIRMTYLLEEGSIYEISAPQSWRSTDRYFCRIQSGAVIRMARDEVLRCLS